MYFTPAGAPPPPPPSVGGAPAAAPVSSLDATACAAEVRELSRRAAKLASSNDELRAYAAAGGADGDGDGDDDGGDGGGDDDGVVAEAIAENVAVLARVEGRLAEVRRRLVALGGEHRL